MNGLDLCRVAWWKWWGNPMEGIHQDHVSSLPLVGIASSSDINDYFRLIQVRSHFELPDLPDHAATSNPGVLAVTLAKPKQLATHLPGLAVLTLPSTIIHARPAEWQERYGIESADDIRNIIEHYRAVPPVLSAWHHSTSVQLPEDTRFGMDERASLGLGIFLSTFFPNIYQRWSITHSYDLLNVLKKLDPFRDIHWNEIMAWLEPGFNALSSEIGRAYQEADIELDESLIEEFTPIDVDALYGERNA